MPLTRQETKSPKMREALTNEIVPHTRANLPKLKRTETVFTRGVVTTKIAMLTMQAIYKNDVANAHETVTYEVSSAYYLLTHQKIEPQVHVGPFEFPWQWC
jgi:hypothetical protein